MAILGRTERRLAFAIVLTAVIPLIVSIYFAKRLVDAAFAQARISELRENLERSFGVYQDLVKSLKEGMRYQADAIASYEPLRAAALLRHPPSIQQELGVIFARYLNLVSLSISLFDGTSLVKHDRGRPVDETTERKLEVRRLLGDADAFELIAVFVTSRARFDELERTSEFVNAYQHLEGVAK